MDHLNLGLALSLVFCSWLFAMLWFAVFKDVFFVKSYQLPLFIKNKRVNKLIGVHLVSLIITKTFVKHLNPRVYLTGKQLADFHRVLHEMQYAAKTHAFAFVSVVLVSIVLLFRTLNLSQFLLDMLVNIVLNVYPVFALQSQASRLAKMVQRKESVNQVVV